VAGAQPGSAYGCVVKAYGAAIVGILTAVGIATTIVTGVVLRALAQERNRK
jgi:hypothetical protein